MKDEYIYVIAYRVTDNIDFDIVQDEVYFSLEDAAEAAEYLMTTEVEAVTERGEETNVKGEIDIWTYKRVN